MLIKFQRYSLLTIVVFLLILLSNQQSTGAPGKINVGITSGVGLPVGWWGDRWDPAISNEISLRYQISPGNGVLIFTGIGKSYFTDLSEDEIVGTSSLQNLPEEFLPYANVTYSSQSGSYRQVPIGFGLYSERLISTINTRQLRGNGSFSMVIQMWNTARAQDLVRELNAPNMPQIIHTDEWSDKAEGSDVGFQLALGISYQLQKYIFLDVSAAYSYVDIGKDNGSVVYWGQPARVWDEDKKTDADGRTDYLQIRAGLRFGG